jgi:hypothetical protein
LALVALDDSVVDGVSQALDSLPPSFTTKSLVRAATKSVITDPTLDLTAPLIALRALYGVRSSSGKPLSVFIDDLLEALREMSPKSFTKNKAAAARGRLERLLAVKPLIFASKIKSLRDSEERTFCGAKILTDLRPVFPDDVRDGPDGFLITHRLKLGFHVNKGRHRDFYVSLDSEDLDSLREAIDRAEKKAQSLQKRLSEI